MRGRGAALAMTEEEFRTLGYDLVDRVAGLLGSLRERRVTPGEPAEAVRAALGAARALPVEGTPAVELLGRATELLFDHSLFNGHPRFFGYITAGAAPIGVLAEMLGAAVNANTGAWKLAPMATEIEEQTVRWLAEFIGYPVDCAGLLVSGGNMANLTCLLAARAAKAGWDTRKDGVAGGARLVVYASRETHTWIQKAADIAGLGTEAIRWIGVDTRQRMDLCDLEAQYRRDVAEGLRPFFVAGTAGTVSTGAVDPLAELAVFCRERGLWFHVDGAYGAFAAGVDGAPVELMRLAQADSVAVDPHKWLYAPLEAGCALVQDRAALREAFSYHPPYYSFGTEATNYLDLGPQNSRGFRALKVWLALQQAGARRYREMIAGDIALAEHLFALAARHPELEAMTHNLSITTFRYVPCGGDDEYLNRLNQLLLAKIEVNGELFCSNAVIDGKFALRFCVVNFRTELEDVEAIPEIVTRLGAAARAELGS